VSLPNLLARGRARAESLMVDSCVIRRRTGSTVDPDTGAEVPTYTQVYEGKCRIQFRGLATESPTSGQQRVDLLTTEIQLPITVTDIAVNDVVEITASLDPDLPGRLLRINNRMHKTHATARRMSVEEITS
jgi:hypothetical protein